jgi:methionyl aminopeptidase
MIVRKSKYELSLMRISGKIVAEVLAELRQMTKPGVTTWELDEKAEKIIRQNKAIPTFKGYFDFPATICASVNEEVVHGIPSKDRVLQEGDIISIDVGATYKGLVGDSAVTIPVGEISEEKQKLLKATEEALYAGIEASTCSNFLDDVSGAIEDICKKYQMGLVRNYGGHGVGRKMHEEPFIHNFRTGNKGPKLKSGMTICLEPMFNLGTDDVHTLPDGWTVVTDDAKASAHFEHTIALTNKGPEILTKLS